MPKRRTKDNEIPNGKIIFDFLTDKQSAAWETYKENDILFLSGPAGTGKTHLAMAFAIRDILSDTRNKIILTRPVVEAGERLGYLPGRFADKIDPYMKPLWDCYHKICPGHTMKNKVIESAFEIAPIAYMRGRTFENSTCVFDEAQNATIGQLILFLTRFGTNSKLIITGDPFQSDLNGHSGGLTTIINRLNGTPRIGIVQFTNEDVVRHPLVVSILNKLTEEESANN